MTASNRITALYGRPWALSEYLLVLDTYFQTRGETRHGGSAAVIELAKLIGRTPASVNMRMENFASVDPTQTSRRRGLLNAGPICEKIFREWEPKQDHLRSCADVLRIGANESISRQMGLFEPEPVALPRAFGKYELLDLIGQGGFGRVYSCVHTGTGHTYAIKIIDTDRISSDDIKHRFLREIRALRAVDHTYVISLHEDNLEDEHDFPGFVMELAETSLTKHLFEHHADYTGRRMLSEEESAGIFFSVAKAIDALHTNTPRIIHRDINPNNILRLSDGRWVLADFSLAKFLDTVPFTNTFETRTIQAGLGTPNYCAPEQYRNFRNTDEKTDIFAIGVLLWELFNTVGHPLERDNTGLAPDLQAAFLKATERNPEKRFQTVSDFIHAVKSALGVRNSQSEPPRI